MPVLIDQIDTEIELGSRQPPKETAQAPSAVPAPVSVGAPADAGRSVMAMLEAEFEQYLRMRG